MTCPRSLDKLEAELETVSPEPLLALIAGLGAISGLWEDRREPSPSSANHLPCDLRQGATALCYGLLICKYKM